MKKNKILLILLIGLSISLLRVVIPFNSKERLEKQLREELNANAIKEMEEREKFLKNKGYSFDDSKLNYKEVERNNPYEEYVLLAPYPTLGKALIFVDAPSEYKKVYIEINIIQEDSAIDYTTTMLPLHNGKGRGDALFSKKEYDQEYEFDIVKLKFYK